MSPTPDPDYDLAVQRLAHRLMIVRALETHLEGRHWHLATPGSELAADDALTSPLQASHLVGHCLAVGLDCLRSARMLLTDPDNENVIRLPLTGQYPVLRAAAEAGALAVWVLQPDDSHERVSRALRARWTDIVQDDQMIIATMEEAPGDEKAEVGRKNKIKRANAQRVRGLKARLRDVAARAKVDMEIVRQGLPGFGPIISDAAGSTGIQPNIAVGMWRLVSGLSHPSASRSMSMSAMRSVDDDPASPVVNAELTARPEIVNTAIEAAWNFHSTALDLAARRGGRDELRFRFPEGFPLPPGY